MPHHDPTEFPDDVLMNKQFVGLQGDHVVILNPTNRMTAQEAMVHAAWLVLVASDSEDEFGKILTELKKDCEVPSDEDTRSSA